MVITSCTHLEKRVKNLLLWAAVSMFLSNLLYAFTLPVLMPSLFKRYELMPYYALFGGFISLLNTIIIPIGGKLSDRYGRRSISLWCLAVRTVLLILCALPLPGPAFLVLLILCNASVAILSAVPYAMLSDIARPEQRMKWFGIFGTVNGIALLAGLLGGGLIVDLIGPSNGFLFFIPFGVISFLPIAKYYPDLPTKENTPLDVKGIVLLSAGIACLIAWFNFGGILFGRFSGPGILILASSVVLIFILVRRERRAADPLINLDYFKDRSFLLSCLIFVCIAPMTGLCTGSLALFGQVGLGLSATMSGTLALPKNMVLFIMPSFLGAWIAKDTRRFRSVFLLCGASIAAAGVFSAMWTTSTGVVTIYAVMLIFGIATSAQSVTIQPYMQLSVPPEDVGSATSVLMFCNSLGIVVYSLVHGSVYNLRFIAASAAGGEARAVSETFSAMAWFTAGAGVMIILTVLLLYLPAKGNEALVKV